MRPIPQIWLARVQADSPAPTKPGTAYSTRLAAQNLQAPSFQPPSFAFDHGAFRLRYVARVPNR